MPARDYGCKLNNDNMQGRMEWLDAAKGIGIFFIVLGHVIYSYPLRGWIFSFHVPFFFILSGVSLKITDTFPDFLKKKVKSLLVPYYIFSILSLGIYNLLLKFIPSMGESQDILQSIFIIIYGNSRPDIMRWNTPLWFLPCLFSVVICAYFIERWISRFTKALVIRIIVIGVLCLLGILFQCYVDIRLPFHFESGLFLLGFLEMGVLLSQSHLEQHLNKANTGLSIIIACISIIFGCVISNINGFAEVRIYQYGKTGVLFVLSSVLLSFAFILIAYVIQYNKLLCMSGFYSLGILVMHKFPVVFFQKICPGIKDLVTSSTKAIEIISSIVISIIVIGICLVITKMIQHYFPWMFGKKIKQCKTAETDKK